MKKLNQQATKIFCRLLTRLNDEVYLTLFSEGYMPLSIECIGTGILTPSGEAKLYSISHTCTMNGDLMRDPEMCFFVIDKRSDPRQYHLVGIYPQMYQLDNLGIYEESISVERGDFTVIKTLQWSHCQFANQWMKNISSQGFLNKQR